MKQKTPSMDNDLLARRLLDALTMEQLVGLVARLLDRVSEAEHDELCNALDPDTATVFRRLLKPPTSAVEERVSGGITTDAKFAQRFRSAVVALDGVLAELGDEDGAYIYQEHHWEQPDFDAPQLANDIEARAKDLLPLLQRAAELELEEEGWFSDLFREISDGIETYPEYIYTEEGVCLERTATECVLKWLDFHSDSAAEFLGKLVTLMDEPGLVGLDNATIRTYLLEAWGPDRRAALYEAIQALRSSDAAFRATTDKPYMLWHKIRYALAGEFSADDRTKIAEESVAEDWTKGVELVDAAVADGNSARALEFCRKTVNAYYRHRSLGRERGDFNPGTTALFDYSGSTNQSQPIARILALWADLAAGKGDLELVELLTVQVALFTQPENWTAVRSAFDQARTANATVLLAAWKELTLERQQNAHYLHFDAPEDPIWPEWLLDAGLANRFQTFTEKAMQWLAKDVKSQKRATKHVFARQTVLSWPAQLSLAADLLALDSDGARYPCLKATLIRYCQLSECPSRQEWLRSTDVPCLTAAAVSFVSRHIESLIPSPEEMSGDYEPAAAWLAAAHEVAPDTARDILRMWQSEYKRRRNLWRDLRKHGIPRDQA